MSKVITGNVAGIDFEAPLVLSDAHLRTVLGRLEGVQTVALDIETTGYEGQKDYGPSSGEIRLVQLAWHGRNGTEVVVIDGQATDLSLLVPFFEGPAEKVVHYSPFERSWIGHHLGAKLEGVIDTCYLGQSINKKLRGDVAENVMGGLINVCHNREDFDSLTKQLFKMADMYTLPSGREVTLLEVKSAFKSTSIPLEGWKLSERATLAAMVKRYIGHDLDKEGQTSDWSGFLTDEQLVYAAGDAVVTRRLLGPVRRMARDLQVYGNMTRRVKHDLERG